MKLLLLTLSSILINVSLPAQQQSKVVETFIEQRISKRQYYDVHNIIAQVNFDRNKNKVAPNDSIRFRYSKALLIGIDVYQYSKGRFAKSSDKFLEGSYAELYNKDLCKIKLGIEDDIALREILVELCDVRNSILSDGKEGISKETTHNKGDISYIEYRGLDTKFRDLSLDIQSYFYDGLLENLIVKIRNHRIVSEEFVFKNGSFVRSFEYNSHGLAKIVETVTK